MTKHTTQCSIPDCNKPAEKRGWCGMHYRRWQRYGDTSVTKKRANGTGCVYIDDAGYFRFRIGKQSYPLHRLIMEAVLGRKLGKDEIVHHKNEDRQDNRPDNLEVMTRSEHISLHHKGIPDNPLNTDTEKHCPRCDTVKPKTEFYPEPKMATGCRTYCKQCCSELSKAYNARQKNN